MDGQTWVPTISNKKVIQIIGQLPQEKRGPYMVPALAACAYTIWPLPGRDEIIFDVKLSEISATWHVNLCLGLKF